MRILNLLVLIFFVSDAAFAEDGNIKYFQNFPRMNPNGNCELQIRGSAKCPVREIAQSKTQFDNDILINSAEPLTHLEFDGLISDNSRVETCQCRSSLGLPKVNFSCDCPLSRNGMHWIVTLIQCRSELTGRTETVTSPQLSFDANCKPLD